MLLKDVVVVVVVMMVMVVVTMKSHLDIRRDLYSKAVVF